MVYVSITVAEGMVYKDSYKKGRVKQIFKDGQNLNTQSWEEGISGERTRYIGNSQKTGDLGGKSGSGYTGQWAVVYAVVYHPDTPAPPLWYKVCW